MIKYSILFILLLIHFSEQKVRVTILYDALCSDSVNFINNQLQTCYESIKDHIDIELIPYGKTTQKYDKDNRLQFECPKGPRECALGIYHACGLKYASSQSDQVKYVSCMMTRTNAVSTASEDESITRTCAENSGISFANVSRCYGHVEGKALFAIHGDRAKTYSPVAFVPKIIFNNTFDQNLQDRALTQFLWVINELCINESYQKLISYRRCDYCYPYYQPYQYPYGQNTYQNPYGQNTYQNSYGQNTYQYPYGQYTWY